VLAEYNIPPASTAKEFVMNNRLVLRDLEDIIKPHGLRWTATASAEFDGDQLMTIQAIVGGCEPDFNAWNGQMNDPPELSGQLRSAGGHLHVSFPVDQGVSREDVIRAMDCMLGVPSVLMDNDVRRRSLYGKAGAHRPKFKEQLHPYDGAEYRVLSNFWLQSDERMEWAFNQTLVAFERAQEINQLLAADVIDPSLVISCINAGNKAVAEQLVDFFNIKMVA
jgi:hypothetical protein